MVNKLNEPFKVNNAPLCAGLWECLANAPENRLLIVNMEHTGEVLAHCLLQVAEHHTVRDKLLSWQK